MVKCSRGSASSHCLAFPKRLFKYYQGSKISFCGCFFLTSFWPIRFELFWFLIGVIQSSRGCFKRYNFYFTCVGWSDI